MRSMPILVFCLCLATSSADTADNTIEVRTEHAWTGESLRTGERWSGPYPELSCGRGLKFTGWEAMYAISRAVCQANLNGWPTFEECVDGTTRAECPTEADCAHFLCGNHPERGDEIRRFAVCYARAFDAGTFGPECFTLFQGARK